MGAARHSAVGLWGLLAFLHLAAVAHADPPTVKSVVLVTATVQESPPEIQLSWDAPGTDVTGQTVYRRPKGGSAWATLSTPGPSATGYVDSGVAVGVAYEYYVHRTFSGQPYDAYGYLASGIRVPAIEQRGVAILLVDDTMASPLAAEIAQFAEDLAGDGWLVARQDVSRTATAAQVRAIIQGIHGATPAEALILLGHVPVPYSGNIWPDGHSDHRGAWPADVYYGDIDGVWTDSVVDVTSQADAARNSNHPGDGKFDQSALPSDVELQVGRIDLAKMTSFTDNETELLRRYLDRNHDYRFQQGNYAAVQRRSLILDHREYFGGEVFASSPWRESNAFFANPPTLVQSGHWFDTLGSESHLFAHANGGGQFDTMDQVGTSADFANPAKPSLAVFASLLGSYFGDWDSADNFLRAPLAGPASLALATFWAGRPHWHLYDMALGETIGYGARLTQNNDGLYVFNESERGVHIALMGDPTLRLPPTKPPASPTASGTLESVDLAWAASSEADGYHVYRAESAAGPYARLTAAPVAGTSYSDTSAIPGTAYRYMIRAIKLETNPSGSFYNLSQGVFVEGGALTTSIEDWRTAFFGSPDDAGDGADDFDFERDGLVNLIEYALGLDPKIPSVQGLASPAIETVEGEPALVFTYVVDLAKPDISYVPEVADSPAGPWSAIGSTSLGIANGKDTRRVVHPLAGAAAFLRLRITRP